MSVAGRLSTQQPTVVLSFPRVLEAESGGVNPRITMVNTTTFSVLAEMDVFLPCKAKGNPEPVITWTKISTGKIENFFFKEQGRNQRL